MLFGVGCLSGRHREGEVGRRELERIGRKELRNKEMLGVVYLCGIIES